jgi:hypothetical protein
MTTDIDTPIDDINENDAHTARGAFANLLADVVKDHVFSEAERAAGSGELNEATLKKVKAGQTIDDRRPKLMTLSGKGGWSPDPEKRARYAACLSNEKAARNLRLIGAVAFLHDADKIIGTDRTEALEPADIAALMTRFGINDHLAKGGITIDPAQMLALIDECEKGRSGRLRPGERVPERWMLSCCIYVRLADRLEGAFLKHEASSVGTERIDAARRELSEFDGLRAKFDADSITEITIRNAQIPEMLDAFQIALSNACADISGQPPLMESHHDGIMTVVIPTAFRDEIVERALASAAAPLAPTLRIETNARGSLSLMGARITLAGLRGHVEDMPRKKLESLLRGKLNAIREARGRLDQLFAGRGPLIATPDLETYAGQLVPLWIDTESFGARDQWILRRTLELLALMRHDNGAPAQSSQRNAGLNTPPTREAQCVSFIVGHEGAVPEWIEPFDDATRRLVIAALAAMTAWPERASRNDLDAMASGWIDGRADATPPVPGMNNEAADSENRLAEAMRSHLRLLAGGETPTADETLGGRCHYSNEPVAKSAKIDKSTGLYGLKISAFSGREGRPAHFRSPKAETLVSVVAEAENRLRTIAFERDQRSAEGRNVPVRVTSPSTSGLYPALVFDRADAPEDFAMSDVLRTKIDGIHTKFNDETGLRKRHRIAHYEEFPARLVGNGKEPGQLGFVAMVVKTAMRTGRPVHVFRGQPVPRPEFVYFDTLPGAIEMILGSNGLRLEQLPEALRLLRGIETCASTTGLGIDLAMAIADPATRFSAACDLMRRVDLRGDKTSMEMSGSYWFADHLLREENTRMGKNDGAYVSYGKAVAAMQRAANASDGGGYSELGMKFAVEAAEQLAADGITDDESMIAAIAESLATNFKRNKQIASSIAREKRGIEELAAEAAAIFVQKVWHGPFENESPSSARRRIALATYRYSFTNESRRRLEMAKAIIAIDKDAKEEDETAEAAV